MPILRLLKTAAFDPKETKIFASAFDTAWNVLRRSGSTLAANDKAAMTREVLAEQIVKMGQAGERDHQRLVKHALVHVASCEMISRGFGRLIQTGADRMKGTLSNKGGGRKCRKREPAI